MGPSARLTAPCVMSVDCALFFIFAIKTRTCVSVLRLYSILMFKEVRRSQLKRSMCMCFDPVMCEARILLSSCLGMEGVKVPVNNPRNSRRLNEVQCCAVEVISSCSVAIHEFVLTLPHLDQIGSTVAYTDFARCWKKRPREQLSAEASRFATHRVATSILYSPDDSDA